MIKGGYILQPRIIQESDISVAPPYVREIWSYLLREANSHDQKYDGHFIKRGQLFRSYEDIREGTKWFIGWRKMTYNENQTKKAMKFLRDTGRIGTTKELGGVLITILKYDYYQDPKNYDRTTKDHIDRTIAEPLQNQPLPDNNKNDKNEKNEKNKNIEERTQKFKDSVFIFKNQYPEALLLAFTSYWTEKSINGSKMRFEKETVFEVAKRLTTWSNNEEKFKRNGASVKFDSKRVNSSWGR